MAQRLSLLKLLQEIRGFAEAGNRGFEVRPVADTVPDLRPTNCAAVLPVRRFSIPVSHEHHEETPLNIPIVHAAGATARVANSNRSS